MKIPSDVVHFFNQQAFVIVATLDENKHIHCSAKGIVDIESNGVVRLVDLYMNRTYRNITRQPTISLTAVDEHRFQGYTLQGTAKIVPVDKIPASLAESWETRIIGRISKRVIKSVQTGMKSKYHYEMDLPRHPKYLIEIAVVNIIDLSPARKGDI
ncbi:MAG: pyridoxamine 5'-phosphate oxidase family protein [Candidatus Omnitrophica bacterium]|nr:pyridoxamine 5'-phosphate oxidase family protein [Candidatus Omnitrophota bacterium]